VGVLFLFFYTLHKSFAPERKIDDDMLWNCVLVHKQWKGSGDGRVVKKTKRTIYEDFSGTKKIMSSIFRNSDDQDR